MSVGNPARAVGARRPPALLRPRVAARALAEDEVLGPWVRRVGPIRLPELTGGRFPYLVRSILHQQLAGKAAATIHGRFVEAVGGAVTADSILATPEPVLRAAGLSRGKLQAVHDLARRAPELRLEEIDALSDEEIVWRLTRVRGIGPWTAHMFLIFALRRADVWPVGDLGVRAGYARVHGLEAAPTQKTLLPLGERYRPWRSAAAWYFWRALEVEPPPR